MGLPCVFVRLSGCNLKCNYCDTQYAGLTQYHLTIEEILAKVLHYECPLVEITGGEPLSHIETPALADALLDAGMRVLVETNGSYNINKLPHHVIRIMDIKCPGSGESKNMDWANILRLKTKDQVKFVLSHREDYNWAKKIITQYQLTEKAHLLMSAVPNRLNASDLADWILKDRLRVRLQVQLHKMIWLNAERGR